MATVTESAGSATDRSSYLREILAVLWPEPARIERRGRAAPGLGVRPGRDTGGAGQTEFLMVPNETRPVLLVPRRPRRATAAALRHYKASAVGRRRLAFRGLAAAAQLGLADVLPHRITVGPAVDGPEADVLAYLRKVLDRDLVVSLRVGPPRANRKPVLELLSPSGEMLGFAKVGITGLTRELVRAEAAALEVLAAAGLTRLEVPLLMHHGPWRDHEVLVQTPLSGSGRPVSRAMLTSAMAELATAAGVTTQVAGHSGYWRALRSRLEACAEREPAAALLQVMDDLQATAEATTLAFGSWHGDWTPWNMACSGDQVLVWDWERFESGVPIGYDAVHYQLQGAVERNGAGGAQSATEAALFTAPMTLGPLGVRPGYAVFVAALYLLEIATRYTCDGAAEAGARLGDVSTWLLPPLSRYARRLPGPPSPGGAQP
ncbi:MAG: phosphotransferase [Streptosporangiaceae bacterium]